MDDAQPRDLYVDRGGAVYRVVGIFNSPSVVLDQLGPGAIAQRHHVGTDSLIAQAMKRIWRAPEEPSIRIGGLQALAAEKWGG